MRRETRCWQLFRYRLFFPSLSFYPCHFSAFLRERSVLTGWRRSNTFPVPSNGVGTLSDAAVEVLIHVLLPHARLFRLACSCIPSTRSPPPRSLLRTLRPPPVATLRRPSSLYMTRTRTWHATIATTAFCEFRECIYYLLSRVIRIIPFLHSHRKYVWCFLFI